MARPRKKTPEIEAKQGFPGRRRGKTRAEIAAVARDAVAAASATEGEAKRPARVPPAPEWLPEDARPLWGSIGADLVRRQIIKTAGEWQEFGRYVHHCWMWGKLQAECVTPRGRLRTTYKTTTADGNTRRLANPAFDQMLKLDMRLKDYEDRYGLNPQARTALLMRIGDPKKPPRDAAPPAGDEPPSGAAPAAKPGSPLGILNTKRLN
jgi:phage terminase small subunit